jgi:hypothetical protein
MVGTGTFFVDKRVHRLLARRRRSRFVVLTAFVVAFVWAIAAAFSGAGDAVIALAFVPGAVGVLTYLYLLLAACPNCGGAFIRTWPVGLLVGIWPPAFFGQCGSCGVPLDAPQV